MVCKGTAKGSGVCVARKRALIKEHGKSCEGKYFCRGLKSERELSAQREDFSNSRRSGEDVSEKTLFKGLTLIRDSGIRERE